MLLLGGVHHWRRDGSSKHHPDVARASGASAYGKLHYHIHNSASIKTTTTTTTTCHKICAYLNLLQGRDDFMERGVPPKSPRSRCERESQLSTTRRRFDSSLLVALVSLSIYSMILMTLYSHKPSRPYRCPRSRESCQYEYLTSGRYQTSGPLYDWTTKRRDSPAEKWTCWSFTVEWAATVSAQNCWSRGRQAAGKE